MEAIDVTTIEVHIPHRAVQSKEWKQMIEDQVGAEYHDSRYEWETQKQPDDGYIIKATPKPGTDVPRRKGNMTSNALQFSVNSWDMLEQVLTVPDIRTFYLNGPPGTGKTWAAYYYGRVKGKSFYAITITDETSAAELRGHFIFKGGDAVWHDGPFVRAMREGVRLVINEITNASSDVLALLYPILEDYSTACLTLPSGETIRPSDGFHVVATDNRSPELLPEALQDRFMAYVEVLETNPAALACLPADLREVAAKTIGDGDRRVSARGWHSLDKMRQHFSLEDACKLAFGMARGNTIHDAIVIAQQNQIAEQKKITISSEQVAEGGGE
jgi:midasin (ATPase involved in ribosome maturation)